MTNIPEIINMTPHTVTVVEDETTQLVLAEFPPSGKLARVRAMSYQIGSLGETIPLTRTVFGEVDGLPEPNGRTRYIVSAMVLAAVSQSGTRSTADLLSPDQFVRDGAGRIIACRALRMAS